MSAPDRRNLMWPEDSSASGRGASHVWFGYKNDQLFAEHVELQNHGDNDKHRELQFERQERSNGFYKSSAVNEVVPEGATSCGLSIWLPQDPAIERPALWSQASSTATQCLAERFRHQDLVLANTVQAALVDLPLNSKAVFQNVNPPSYDFSESHSIKRS
jgi:hypothetical protein